MSWSLGLQHGDLALGGGRLGTVTGVTKLAQDLRCHILEHIGTDDLHPTFGSDLDGGAEFSAFANDPGVIGEILDDASMSEIVAEIQRIITEHQNKQLTRAKSDRQVYGKATLTPQEVLIGASIGVAPFEDTVAVAITLTTGTGDDVSLILPLANGA